LRYGRGNAPCEPEHVGDAENFEGQIEGGKLRKNPQEEHADGKHHHHVPQRDAQHMRQRAPQSVIRAGGHQHQVVRSGCDGARKGKRK